jgi:hypothetical protein
LRILLILALTLAPAAHAQSASTPEPLLNNWKDPYRWSIAAVSLATAADVASSLKFSADGQREANPLLRNSNGAYSAKSVAIEAGALGGTLVLQHYLIRKHPGLRMPFLISNYALAGFQVFNVARNVKY